MYWAVLYVSTRIKLVFVGGNSLLAERCALSQMASMAFANSRAARCLTKSTRSRGPNLVMSLRQEDGTTARTLPSRTVFVAAGSLSRLDAAERGYSNPTREILDQEVVSFDGIMQMDIFVETQLYFKYTFLHLPDLCLRFQSEIRV
jgi:hypothetical protein